MRGHDLSAPCRSAARLSRTIDRLGWRSFRVAVFILAGLAMPMSAAAREPLLMDGKDTLFQRVLIRDATERHDSPQGTPGDMLVPLQPLFVYARDGDWMQVGMDDAGSDLFWIEAATTVPWKQNIVATFEGSENVGRVLFFANEDAVYDTIESEAPGMIAGEMRDSARAAERGGPPSEDVVALGPRATPDLKENLYVMPIMESEEAVLESNGAYVNILKVAVARAGATGKRATPVKSGRAIEDAPASGAAPDASEFRAGVVFVVDTTISMEPFIQGTRQALEEVYRAFSASDIGEAVSFGLIGYRDSLAAAPDLGYDTRTFVTLDEGSRPGAFLEGISRMTEADSPSRHFREDSFAAIDHALRDLDWSPFGARYVVLVTDAGPRDAGDEYSSTGLTGRALNSLVKERLGAAIAVMHLRTGKGARDHATAEAAYRDLARQANQAALYFPVENGDPGRYRSAAQQLAEIIVDQVFEFRSPEGSGQLIEEASKAEDGDTLEAALRSAGRTMQLAYLGRETGAEAPDVFEAYVADRDFDRPGLKPLSIRLLINKRDLSDLDEAMKVIIRKGEENILSADQMFNQVLSAAADMSRRPDKVARNADTTLAQAVSVEEMLEDLPYRSQIMSITENDWIAMSISEQQTILNSLADKVELYARYNAATDQWVDYLGTGAAAESLVYPMRLDDLP